MLFAAESQYFSPTPSAKVTGNREVTAGRYQYVNVEKKLVQYEHKIGYWKGKAENRHFVTLGNFGVRLLKFVQALEQLPNYTGFVVQVSQKLKCGGIDAVKEG